MSHARARILLGSTLALVLLIGLNSVSQPTSALASLPSSWQGPPGLRRVQAPARGAVSLPWDDGARPRGVAVVLRWDQLGTMSAGIGPSFGVNAAQALMRFGGGSATTGLAPRFRPVAASWSIFTCTASPCPPRVPRNNRMDTQRVNLWNAVFDPGMNRLEPGVRVFNTVFRSPGTPPGPGTNTVNQFVVKTFTGAPQFLPSEHLFAGIGASGPNNTNQFFAFVAEGVDPDAHREWFGAGATIAATVGPTTFSTQLAAYDFGIRLIVDPGVPPELDVSTGPSRQGMSKVRTFVGS